MERTDQPTQPPTPVADDAPATTAALQARAAKDLADAQASAQAKQEAGGTGIREGVLEGGN
jgi:hypothetical protein